MKYKSISIYYESVPEGDIAISQAINENGKLSGIGNFNIRDRKQQRIQNRKYKNLYLFSSSIPEGLFEVVQKVNYKGNILGTGNFKISIREIRRKQHREWQRKHHLGTVNYKGDIIRVSGLNKRSYPDGCELCNRNNCKLYYHHWEKSNYNKGMWLCFKCHQLAEIIDIMHPLSLEELIIKYLDKRFEIDNEFSYCIEW